MKTARRAAAAFLTLLLLVVAIPLMSDSTGAAASTAGMCRFETGAIAAAGSIAGYQGAQLENAGAIMNVASSMGLGVRGQQLGVMTAMEESTLNNINYGDNAVNPDGTIADSIGLFQQQSSWGSIQERMDPSTAARLFFERVQAQPDWTSAKPSDVAHAVQVNDFAWRYDEHWDQAVAVVAALTKLGKCSTAPVAAGGWTRPSASPITSPFGMRRNPVTGVMKVHSAVDFSNGCGAPIFAAAAGTVSRVYVEPFGAWVIEIDHGSGTKTSYVHMFANGIGVREGEQVAAGQQIAVEGTSGQSTGCHLHFIVSQDGQDIDPLPFLRDRGVDT